MKNTLLVSMLVAVSMAFGLQGMQAGANLDNPYEVVRLAKERGLNFSLESAQIMVAKRQRNARISAIDFSKFSNVWEAAAKAKEAGIELTSDEAFRLINEPFIKRMIARGLNPADTFDIIDHWAREGRSGSGPKGRLTEETANEIRDWYLRKARLAKIDFSGLSFKGFDAIVEINKRAEAKGLTLTGEEVNDIYEEQLFATLAGPDQRQALVIVPKEVRKK